MNMNDLKSGGPLRSQEIIQLGKDICEALSFCEIYHIVYGDLCPDTIYVAEGGRYKLLDTSYMRNRSKATSDIVYDYMAPEVHLGKTYDSRADIYSLGLILYQYLNDDKLPHLTVPLDKATYEQRLTAMNRRLQGIELPRPCNATNELASVIAKACEVNPKSRYQNAEEFKDALTAIGVFLGDDLSALVNEYGFLDGGIYVENEVVDMVAATIDQERRRKREHQNTKEANARNKGSWILIFIVLVLSTCVIVLLTKVDYTRDHALAISQSVTPTLEQALVVNPIMMTTIIPTVQPTNTVNPQIIEPIEDEATKALTTITMSGQGLSEVTSMKGIDHAIVIDVSNNQLSDISVLKEAGEAKIMGLSKNQIASVEPLSELVNLKALDISKNNINSLTMLRKLEQLEVLSVSNNLITSLEGLENMRSLRILYVSDNQIEDITILEQLTTLEFIDLSNNKVKENQIEELKIALPECIIVSK